MTQARRQLVDSTQVGTFHCINRCVLGCAAWINTPASASSTANAWLPKEVASRWVRLYPAQNAELCAQKMAAILENSELIAEYRARLTNLSWFMKSLSEQLHGGRTRKTK